MATGQYHLANQTVFDENGDAIAGAKLYAYAYGTTTPMDTYTDSGLTQANTNPIVADALGTFGNIWLKADVYKFVLKSANDATVYLTEDAVYKDITLAYLSSAPGVAFPGMIYRNTSDGNEYHRNAANDAWINKGAYESVGNTATVTEQLAGTSTSKYSTPDSVAALWEKGTDIASATVLSLPSTGGGFFNVTGTTSIASIVSATSGRQIILHFTSTPTVQRSATLETLTGGDMQAAAGTIATFVRDGDATNWKMITWANSRKRWIYRGRQVYTANATWTRPEDVTHVLVRCQGPGGGGGASETVSASNGSCASGGSAGGYAEAWVASVGSSIAVTVGTGGGGGASAAAAGSNGSGSTSFGSHCVAAAGTGGTAGVASGSSSIAVAKVAGGAGTTGDLLIAGGSGGFGWRINAAAVGGDGGASQFGRGGRGNNSFTGSGNNDDAEGGIGYGSGGGGGAAYNTSSFSRGGAGRSGLVIVEQWTMI